MALTCEPWRTLWQTLILGRGLNISEVSGPGLSQTDSRGFAWQSDTEAPHFDLAPREGGYPQGWVLVRAKLIRKGSDFTTRLKMDVGEGFEAGPVIELPVSAKGNLLEVIELPPGIRKMWFEPLQTAGSFEKTPFEFYALGMFGRLVYMARRVIHTLWSEPSERLRRVGLTPWHALWDLKHAYHQAGLLRHYSPHPSYSLWLEQYASLTSADIEQIKRHIRTFRVKPEFQVMVSFSGADPAALQATLDSLDAQLYQEVKPAVLDLSAKDEQRPAVAGIRGGMSCRWVDAGELGTFLEQVNASLADRPLQQFVAIIRAGDQLSPHALYWVAAMMQSEQGTALVYTDEDGIAENGERHSPRFKPDWSFEHLRSTNYVGQLVVFRGREIDFAGGVQEQDCFGNIYDLLLRVGEVLAPEWVRHIPAVLCHRQVFGVNEQNATSSETFEREALTRHFARCAIQAEVLPTHAGCRRLNYALPGKPPLVSIIIPNRDRCSLLRRCVDSILSKTAYPHWEILVVDNQSAEPDTLAYLDQMRRTDRVRILDYSQPFNFSAINNFAMTHANGEVLCLLNNDTEVITPDWLGEMLGHLQQRDVGVVGAKLLYPDGHVQHAGDAVGVGGCADHMHSMIDGEAAGYCNRAQVAQELSAVTAACMLTWKGLYSQLGGLNATHLKVAFNDVDYCLRVWEAGYRVVWTPHARLYHHESATRGRHRGPQEIRANRAEANYVRNRWRDRMQHDPYYNPNLNYAHADFTLSHSPRLDKPWQR